MLVKVETATKRDYIEILLKNRRFVLTLTRCPRLFLVSGQNAGRQIIMRSLGNHREYVGIERDVASGTLCNLCVCPPLSHELSQFTVAHIHGSQHKAYCTSPSIHPPSL